MFPFLGIFSFPRSCVVRLQYEFPRKTVGNRQIHLLRQPLPDIRTAKIQEERRQRTANCRRMVFLTKVCWLIYSRQP